jgi:uncharacterized protein YndB with AHSA1/START domain
MHAGDRPHDGDPEILIVRTFAAPPALVFAAWSTAEHLQRWYAPTGCTLAACAVDFRVGGALRLCIRTPDGHECWCSGSYQEIVAPTRLAFSLRNTDAHGVPLLPGSAGMDPEWPTATVVTVTLRAVAGGTELTLRQNASERVAKRTGAHPSWLAMLERLAQDLAGA